MARNPIVGNINEISFDILFEFFKIKYIRKPKNGKINNILSGLIKNAKPNETLHNNKNLLLLLCWNFLNINKENNRKEVSGTELRLVWE